MIKYAVRLEDVREKPENEEEISAHSDRTLYGIISGEHLAFTRRSPEELAEAYGEQFRRAGKGSSVRKDFNLSYNCPLELVSDEETMYTVQEMILDERKLFEEALFRVLSKPEKRRKYIRKPEDG